MSDTSFETDQERFADKIAKLLAKAESCAALGNTGEAETFIVKAQELMTKYAIDQAMLDAARGVSIDEIEQRMIFFTGNWRRELMTLAHYVGTANNCRSVQYQTTHDDGGRKAVKVYDGGGHVEVTSRKKAIKLTLTGFKTDLNRVTLLEASLRIQAMSSVIHWWESVKVDRSYYTYSQKVRARAEFLEGFAEGVQSKLYEANREAQKQASATEAQRTNTTSEAASASVSLVLRSRSDRVDEWYDKTYGKLRKARHSYRQTVDGSANTQGFTAGRSANTSTSQATNRGAKAIG